MTHQHLVIHGNDASSDDRLDRILSLVPRYGLEYLFVGIVRNRFNRPDLFEYSDSCDAAIALHPSDREELVDIVEAMIIALPAAFQPEADR